MENRAHARQPFDIPIELTHLISIHYFEYARDYKYPGEQHDFWELVYVDRGQMLMAYDDRQIPLSQEELLLMAPNVPHAIRADEEHPSNIFITSFAAQPDAALYEAASQVLRLPPESRALIRALVQEGERAYVLPMEDHRCLKTRADAPFGSQQLYRLRLEELLIRLVRQARERSGAGEEGRRSRFDETLAGKILCLLEDHVRDRLTLDEVTAQLGYSKAYLSATFKKVYGQNIMSCYTKLKIEEAKYLIRGGGKTIAEISAALGFSSPQYFSRRFHEFTGQSPKQYETSVKGGWSSYPTIVPRQD